jgi:DNA-binding transcriptional ArsR family regulator
MGAGDRVVDGSDDHGGRDGGRGSTDARRGAGAGKGDADAFFGEATSRFVERFAAELTAAGMQRTAARVFAALLASEDASLTSAELGAALRLSPAAVSGAVGYLSRAGMVSREREPGSRRDRYRLHNELWYETFTSREMLLTRWEHVLAEGAEALDGTPAAERLAETAAFFDFLRGELGALMDRWREHRKTPGPAGS